MKYTAKSQISDRVTFAALIALTAMPWSPVRAQSASTSPEKSGQSEIVVTAGKREQRLAEVPGAVSAMTANTLLENQRVSILDYFPQVPGLSVSDAGNGRTSLTIRGVTTGNTQRATVGIVVDDIPFTTSGGNTVSPNLTPDLDPAILERIEVLRGPQGTLYGAATLGGLVKYVTVAPSLDSVHAFGQVDLSSVRHGELGYSARGALNAPLVPEKIGISASMFYRRDPGFIDNAAAGLRNVNRADSFGGRIGLRFKLGEAIDLRLAALTQTKDADGQTNILTDYALRPRSANLDLPAFPNTGDYRNHLQFYTANLTADLGALTLTSLTGYLRNKYIAKTIGTINVYPETTTLFGVNGYFQRNDYRTRKFSQELRLSSAGDSPLQWMLGGFYTNERSPALQQGFAADPATGRAAGLFIEYVFPSTFKEIAGFGDVTFAVTNRLKLEVGGRYSSNKQTYFEVDRGPYYVPPIVLNKKSNDSVFTYLATARWEAIDDIFIYGRVSSGYRPGGPQTAAQGPEVPPQVNPDTTVNYELGVKGRTLGGALDFDVAAYQIDWSDIQVSQTTPPPRAVLYYVNGGKARVRGVEASAQLHPAQGMSISGNVTYADAKLESPGIGFIGSVGDRLPASARWQWNLDANQDFAITDRIRGFAGATASHVGGRWAPFRTRVTNIRQYFPAYTTLDARIGLNLDDRYTLTVWGRNLTDKLGVLGSGVTQGSPNTTANYATSIIRPRTFGVSLAARF